MNARFRDHHFGHVLVAFWWRWTLQNLAADRPFERCGGPLSNYFSSVTIWSAIVYLQKMPKAMTHIPIVLLVSKTMHTDQSKFHHFVNSEIHALLLYILHFDVLACGLFVLKIEPSSSTSVVYLVLVLKPINRCMRKIKTFVRWPVVSLLLLTPCFFGLRNHTWKIFEKCGWMNASIHHGGKTSTKTSWQSGLGSQSTYVSRSQHPPS